jgi:hypothetical protein
VQAVKILELLLLERKQNCILTATFLETFLKKSYWPYFPETTSLISDKIHALTDKFHEIYSELLQSIKF